MRWPRPRFSSVRLRLTLWNVGIVALVLVVLGTTLRYTVAANRIAAVDRSLHRRANGPLRWARNPDPERWSFDRRRGSERDTSPGGRGPAGMVPNLFRPAILDLSGKNVPPFDEIPAWDARTVAPAAAGQIRFTTVTRDDEPLRVISLPAEREGKVIRVVQMAQPLAEAYDEVDRLTRTLLTLIPVGLLVAGLGGAFLTDRALRPVRQVTQAAGQIEAENLSGRLPVKGNDEFSELASTFNAMLGRLEEAFARMERAYEQQRRFTADASHELRTPLTVIKANTSLALRVSRTPEEYRKTLETVDRAADMTSALVQDLLILARSDGGQLAQNRTSVSVREILERAADTVRRPETASVRLSAGDPALRVRGNVNELVRVVTNLLENAARYTPPDGRITLSARADEEQVAVRVEDTGEGILPEHLPHVMERFYRADSARARTEGGTGLGLAICKSIIEAHGGTLAIESAVGHGTAVTVTLPRDHAEAEEAVPDYALPAGAAALPR